MSVDAAPAGTGRRSEPQLCGFSRCRQPLPPPGPRGGRPVEFCPDRSWPGERGCRQLAKAEEALSEALGDGAGPAALCGAVIEFGDHVRQVLGPLGELAAALESVDAGMKSELAATTTRAERADEQAAHDRGLREHAEQAAEQASRQAAEAVARADEHRRDRDEHQARRTQAEIRAKDAELAAVRAQAVADAERARADAAAHRADAERQRAERSAELAADADRRAATAAAERDAALAALVTATDAAATAQRQLAEQLDQARADALTDRTRLDEAHRRLRDLDAAHTARLGDLREALGAVRGLAERHAAAADRQRAVVDRCRELLGTDHDADTLKRHLADALAAEPPGGPYPATTVVVTDVLPAARGSAAPPTEPDPAAAG